MSYAFDPALAPWVPMITDLPFSDIAAARAAEKAMTADLPMYEPDRPVDVRAAVVPGPEGAAQVPVRIYTPVGAEAVGSGLPGLVYLHGGGYVHGSPDFCHSDLLRIADQVGAVVVSVDYRLARASLPGRTGGLLRRTGLDGRARGGAGHRPGPAGHRRRQRGRWARHGLGPDGPGPRRPGALLPVPGSADAGRPNGDSVDAGLHRHPCVEPPHRRDLLEPLPGRRGPPRRPRGPRVCGPGPCRGPLGVAAGVRLRLRVRSPAGRRDELRAAVGTGGGHHRAPPLPGDVPRLRRAPLARQSARRCSQACWTASSEDCACARRRSSTFHGGRVSLETRRRAR